MRKLFYGVLLIALAALPASARGTKESPAAQSANRQAPPADPLSTFVKAQFKNNSNYLIKSAQDMPEDKYSSKLGTQPETRTFAQLIGHVINANYFFCAQAKGEASPNKTDFEHTAQSKAQLAAAMQAAIDYCSSAYGSLTDTTGMEMVTSAGGGSGHPQPRIVPLIRNVIHNNEEYGNLVGYFRNANLVPPSTAASRQGGRGR